MLISQEAVELEQVKETWRQSLAANARSARTAQCVGNTGRGMSQRGSLAAKTWKRTVRGSLTATSIQTGSKEETAVSLPL
jgi:hypothetical protein